ncbi:unnamed protein product [Oppiella nova]|uniref:Uncharacterized protein n=1 Tax=Oppiella nova TaxID=334625 RepID=A0A7R9QWS1_9ACAR|nr:unnamed protein product [Oppiella nova]CAG2177241.1 unnamed protein product [Oppiella nova]
MFESTEENIECYDKSEPQVYHQNLKLQSKLSLRELTPSIEMKTFEVGSLDSSDTYLSCCTHPFTSLADLTEDTNEDNSRAELLHNVYINPMEVMAHQSNNELNFQHFLVGVPLNHNKSDDMLTKKLNVILSDQLCNDSSSTTSTSSPLIKKPKFLQGLRTRFDESNAIAKDFHEMAKQKIKSPFLPYRGRTGSGSKASLLISDLNSDNLKHKKSILKKNDSNSQSREEMERLLPETPKHAMNRVSTTPQTLSLNPTTSLSLPSRPATGFLTPQTSSPSALSLSVNESTNKTVRPSLKQIGSSKAGKQITPPPVSISTPTPPALLPMPPIVPPIPIFQTTSTTRLIGAVAPIQLSAKGSLKKADTPLVRCSNPICYYNRVCRATPLCAGCGHRIETFKDSNDSKPHSVPLTPTTPDSKHDQNMSRQPSNESAPPAYS